MELLLIGALVGGFAVWLVMRRRNRHTVNISTSFDSKVDIAEDSEDRPNFPRFATWSEAMNREIRDDLLFWIQYCDQDGVVTEREIIPKRIHLRPGRPEVKIECFCLLRQAERTFASDRILMTINRQTGRVIRDLGQYLRARY